MDDDLDEPTHWTDEENRVWELKVIQYDSVGRPWYWSGGFTTEFTGVEQPMYSRGDSVDLPLGAIRAVYGPMIPGPKPILIKPGSREDELLKRCYDTTRAIHVAQCSSQFLSEGCACSQFIEIQTALREYFESKAREKLEQKR